ncbi:ATP-binding protein, partial [Streptomyces sp. A3M-1-3]|uniref:ATP-binding protein n=1 Tax=Streptomyces sp. A3M-1-3 TaxID=2962044 RepID=UPI0020B81DEA
TAGSGRGPLEKGPRSGNLASGLPVLTHGHVPGRDFELRLSLDMYAHVRTLRIDVSDARGERRPLRPDEITVPEAGSEDGRGLLLVAELADRWAVLDRVPVGKTVRVEVDLPH